MTSLDFSLSPFWNTSAVRWEVFSLDTGEILANGVSSDHNTAVLVAQSTIRRLSPKREG
jgi:hypothetical protein